MTMMLPMDVWTNTYPHLNPTPDELKRLIKV